MVRIVVSVVVCDWNAWIFNTWIMMMIWILYLIYWWFVYLV